MSISSEQAADAAIFLTIYNEAILTLKESAVRDKDNQIIEQFTNRTISVYNNKIFRRICNPKDQLLNSKNIGSYAPLLKDVRVFQYSHYLFQKHLPTFLTFSGSGRELVTYLKQQNDKLQKQLL